MAEWPTKLWRAHKDDLWREWDGHAEGFGDELEVIPADVGRELYEALSEAIEREVGGREIVESYPLSWPDHAVSALTRYEREVGD